MVLTGIEGDNLVVNHLLLSCRVLGRNVEYAVMAGLRRYCEENNLYGIIIKYNQTAKNYPALKFIKESGWELIQKTGEVDLYYVSVDKIGNKLDHVTLYYNEELPALNITSNSDSEPVKKESNNPFIFDHIGVAVADIEAVSYLYKQLGYECCNKVHDPIQNVYLMLCEKNELDRIELIAPCDNNSPVNNILEVNGDIPYHSCFKVRNIEQTLSYLSTFCDFEIISKAEKAVLFNNKLVQFIKIKDVGLIELLEDPNMRIMHPESTVDPAIVLRVVTFNMESASSFYQKLGYEKGDVIKDSLQNTLKLLMTSNAGAPAIEIILPTINEDTFQYKFLLKNDAHPFQIAIKNEHNLAINEKLGYMTERKLDKTPIKLEGWEWKENIVNESALLHRAFYYSLLFSTDFGLRKIPLLELQQSYDKNTTLLEPQNEVEDEISGIWEDILHKKNIGVTTQFVKLGGNSIKATQVLSRIESVFKVEIGLSGFFNHSTIRELSKLVNKSRGVDYQVIRPVENEEYYDVSHSQSRLWHAYLLDPDQIIYNIPSLYKIEGRFNIEAFRKAIIALFERHESLRTVFKEVNGQPKQVIKRVGSDNFECEIVDLQDIKEGLSEAKRQAKELACTPFDLINGPLIKTRLFKLSGNEYLFCQVTHHIISDGWSVGIEIQDLLHLYRAFDKRQPHQLEPLHIQYKDFASWERAQLAGDNLVRHRKYWLSQFEKSFIKIELPYDMDRTQNMKFVGDICSLTIDENLTNALQQLAHNQQISFFMLMMAVVKTLLYKLSGQTDLVVGIPFANRQHKDLENQIGFYVNSLPIRTIIDPDSSFVEMIKYIKRDTLLAYDHGIYPFNKLLEDLKVDAEPGRHPLFDVMLQMQSEHVIDIKDAYQPDGLNITTIELKKGTSKFDLLFNVIENKNTILIDIEYNTGLFYKSTLLKMKLDILQLLKEIISQPSIKLTTLRTLLVEACGDKKIDRAGEFISEIEEEF